ncbi:MAG TPA: ABC transporter ATP-binding protein [Vicinamibacterales bacterium]|jgi:ABC-type multidrug transport system fused ATPase/permease subunit
MSTARKILALLTPAERRSALGLLALMTVGAALETLGIGLVIPAIAVLIQTDPAASYPRLRPLLDALGDPTDGQLVAIGMLALVAVYLLKTIFCAYLVWRQTRFSFNLQARLSERLFRTYLMQPYTFHLQRNSAQLIRNVVTEVREFTITAILPGNLLITEGLVLLGVASLLIVVQPVGAVVVALVMGVAVLAFHHRTRDRITTWGEARQYHDGLRIQHLQQGLGAAKDVKLLGREDEFLAQYQVHNAESARAANLHQTLLELPRLGLEFLAVVGLAVLVLTMLGQGRDVAGIVPTLGLFAAAAFRLMPSVNRVVGAVHLLRYGQAVVDTLHEELKLHPPVPRAPLGGTTHPQPFQTSIALHSIRYTYPDAPTPALDGLSLNIHKGESIGLVGPSGSGKSTVVDVLLGLLTPDAGQILVDGKDIQSDLRGWQDQIGYVPQSIYLTDDTIRRNVAFGVADDQIDDAAVARAITAAQLEDVVASRPEGLNAMLGERGIRLSGGQRQRMGIARALYHDPAVLVLDEATSALDTATEQGVMQAVMALHGSKTIVVVAHRLSTIEHCDRLYRLERGRMAEPAIA